MNFIAMLLLSHIQDEEDALWALVYVMFEKGWRDIFNQTSNKIALVLSSLEDHFEAKFPKLWDRFQTEDCLTVEAAFTSHVITLFIYDAPFEIATRVFELFLVEGPQVIVDICAAMIRETYPMLMEMEELELMSYLRKDIITDVFAKHELKHLLRDMPAVKLN